MLPWYREGPVRIKKGPCDCERKGEFSGWQGRNPIGWVSKLSQQIKHAQVRPERHESGHAKIPSGGAAGQCSAQGTVHSARTHSFCAILLYCDASADATRDNFLARKATFPSPELRTAHAPPELASRRVGLPRRGAHSAFSIQHSAILSYPFTPSLVLTSPRRTLAPSHPRQYHHHVWLDHHLGPHRHRRHHLWCLGQHTQGPQPSVSSPIPSPRAQSIHAYPLWHS